MNGPCTRTRNSKPIGGTISRENVSLTDAFSLVFLMTVGCSSHTPPKGSMVNYRKLGRDQRSTYSHITPAKLSNSKQTKAPGRTWSDVNNSRALERDCSSGYYRLIKAGEKVEGKVNEFLTTNNIKSYTLDKINNDKRVLIEGVRRLSMERRIRMLNEGAWRTARVF